MEKVLTLPPNVYEKYLKSSNESVSEAEKAKPEAFAYGEVSISFCIHVRIAFCLNNNHLLLDWTILTSVAAGLLSFKIAKKSV